MGFQQSLPRHLMQISHRLIFLAVALKHASADPKSCFA
jgi:hypothetical protein